MLSISFKMQRDQCRKEITKLSYEQSVNARLYFRVHDQVARLENAHKAQGTADYKAAKAEVEQWNSNNEAAIKAGTAKKKEVNNESYFQNQQLAALYRDADYRTLAAEDLMYEERKETIKVELEELEAEMDTFNDMHLKGTQEQTTFSCFGGG